MTAFRRPLVLAVSMVVLLSATSGCAQLKEKFTSTTVADVSYFSDQTVSMLSQTDFGFNRDETVYTREFYDPTGPEEQRLIALTDEVEELFDRIIEYSLQLVIVAKSSETEAERVAAYADLFEAPDEKFLQQVRLSSEVYEGIVASIRDQEDFRSALSAAQPVISAAGWYMNTVLDDLVQATEDLAVVMEKRIDRRYEDVRTYQVALEQEKYAVLRALAQVYRAYRGDEGADEALRTSPAIRKKGLVPKGELSDETLEAIGQHLTVRLNALDAIGREIEDDWRVYRATHAELDTLHDAMMRGIQTARLLTVVWSHAHYQMASGVTKPAEWFGAESITSVTQTLVKEVF